MRRFVTPGSDDPVGTTTPEVESEGLRYRLIRYDETHWDMEYFHPTYQYWCYVPFPEAMRRLPELFPEKLMEWQL